MSFALISKIKSNLVRKALTGGIFIAPGSSVALTAANLFTTGSSEVQLVTPATSGATTVSFQGATTAPLTLATPADAAGATTLQTALRGLSTIGPNGVTVALGTAGDVGKLVVTFAGRLSFRNVPALIATGTGAVASTKTPGVALGLASIAALGYQDGGLLTDEGIRAARAVENEDITAWQQQQPVRSDKTSDTETLSIDFMETNRVSIEQGTGADLSNPVLTGGILSIQKPAIPRDREYRALAMAVDNVDGEEFYYARVYPKIKVTNYADQGVGKGGAIQWGTTYTSFLDSALGYSKDTIFAGPGFVALSEDMGFQA